MSVMVADITELWKSRHAWKRLVDRERDNVARKEAAVMVAQRQLTQAELTFERTQRELDRIEQRLADLEAA